MSHQPIPILLVDDNDDDVVLTREALAPARFLNLVHVATDGIAALSYLRREPPFEAAPRPGLVMLDINMPRMDGFETLAAIKADPSLRGLPVIMLTVSDRDTDVVRAYDQGACTYIRKPVDFGEFVKAVERFEVYWTLVARRPPT